MKGRVNKLNTIKTPGCAPSHNTWKCPFCDLSFMAKPRLTSHMADIHGAKQDITCEICGQKFKRASVRDVHMNVHKGIYRFNCSLCSKGFNVKVDYIGHMNKHRGIKTHFCTMCKESFYQRRPLVNHMRHVHHYTLAPHIATREQC